MSLRSWPRGSQSSDGQRISERRRTSSSMGPPSCAEMPAEPRGWVQRFSSSPPRRRPFLTAEWRYLVMLNYDVDPRMLEPLVPAGTALDPWQERALVSVVGFKFLNTRVLGAAIPFHRHFDEVNLRFYVRRLLPSGEVRRGVVFVLELVPRTAIALLARLAYNEPYRAVAMRSAVPTTPVEMPGRVTYEWRADARWQRLAAPPAG